MPAKNIHSLSLALPSSAPSLSSSSASSPPAAAAATAAGPAASSTTSSNPPPCPSPATSPPQSQAAGTCQIPARSSPRSPTLAATDKPLAGRAVTFPSSFTVLRQGLVTPATPSFPTDSGCKPSSVPQSSEPAAADEMPHASLPLSPSPSSPEEDVAWFFEERYAPLSHLPTPPLSDSCSPELFSDDEPIELLDPEFYGPAKYLASMIPRNASREVPSVHQLHDTLQRANLRLETVALACCVLDCLSSQFLRTWRRECTDEDGYPERCELLAIAALSLAMKFLEDSSYTVRHWTRKISGELFSSYSLATTERLILGDLDYAVLGICTPENIEWNLAELRRCAVPTSNEKNKPFCSAGASAPAAHAAKTSFPLLSEF